MTHSQVMDKTLNDIVSTVKMSGRSNLNFSKFFRKDTDSFNSVIHLEEKLIAPNLSSRGGSKLIPLKREIKMKDFSTTPAEKALKKSESK